MNKAVRQYNEYTQEDRLRFLKILPEVNYSISDACSAAYVNPWIVGHPELGWLWTYARGILGLEHNVGPNEKEWESVALVFVAICRDLWGLE